MISPDLVKTLAIFGVVFIHGSGLFGCSSIFTQYAQAFFRFCVPAFIIIWAYFFEKSLQKKASEYDRAKYLMGRLTHLFTVYLSWSFLYFILFINLETITFKKVITTHFAGYGFAGQYFFLILFQLIILYPLLRYIYIRKTILIIFLLLSIFFYFEYNYFNKDLPGILQKLGDRLFIYWLPYTFIGMALAKNEIPKIPISFIFLIIFIPSEYHLLNNLNRYPSPYITATVLLSSIFFTVSLIQWDIKLKNIRINKIVKYIGQNTLTIFVANPLVIFLINLLIPIGDFNCIHLISKILIPFISTCAILIICLLISEIIKKSRLDGILN